MPSIARGKLKVNDFRYSPAEAVPNIPGLIKITPSQPEAKFTHTSAKILVAKTGDIRVTAYVKLPIIGLTNLSKSA